MFNKCIILILHKYNSVKILKNKKVDFFVKQNSYQNRMSEISNLFNKTFGLFIIRRFFYYVLHIFFAFHLFLFNK